MQKRIQKILIQQQMVLPKETVLVGVSGGADSVCLLMVLSALCKEMDFTIEAVHVEHGIRGEESLSDAAFVKELCEQRNVSCHMVSVDVPKYSEQKGIGMEEAARLLRYEAFVRLAEEKQAKVALAHHMEDNAETILFQMLRGSSLTGLCGMQPVRTDEHGVTYIRPLLSVHRKEIEGFLHFHGMTYCVDSTNAELDYSRNFIRGVILPDMQKVNTKAVAHINHTAAQLVDIRDFLEEETQKAWISAVEIRNNGGEQHSTTDDIQTERMLGCSSGCIISEGQANIKEDKKILINTEILASFHIAIQKEVAYKAIAYMLGGKKDISAVHVQDLLKLCHNQSGKELYLPSGLRAKKEYQYVKLFRKEGEFGQNMCCDGRTDTVSTSQSVVESLFKSTSVDFGERRVVLCTTNSSAPLCHPAEGLSWKEIETPTKTNLLNSPPIEVGVSSTSKMKEEDNTIVISSSLLKQWENEEKTARVSLGNEEYIQIKVFPYHGKIDEIPQKRYTKWLDYDKIKGGFCIRTRQSGDAFITDALGHHKKLKQYLIDEKIPAADRDSLWLLAQEHTVLWLIGGRISEHIKVTDDTKTIIEFTYEGGKIK